MPPTKALRLADHAEASAPGGSLVVDDAPRAATTSPLGRHDEAAARLIDAAVAVLEERGWDSRGGPRRGEQQPLSLLSALYVAYVSAQVAASPGSDGGPNAAAYVHSFNVLRWHGASLCRAGDMQTWERRAQSIGEIVSFARSTAGALRAGEARSRIEGRPSAP